MSFIVIKDNNIKDNENHRKEIQDLNSLLRDREKRIVDMESEMNTLKDGNNSNSDEELSISEEKEKREREGRDEVLSLRKRVVELTSSLAKRTGEDAVRRLEMDPRVEQKSLQKQIKDLTHTLQVKHTFKFYVSFFIYI